MRYFRKLVVWSLLFMAVPMLALAADTEMLVAVETGGGIAASSWGFGLGAGLAVGLAALGCGIGQGLTAGNTTAGIARNPGAAGPMFTNFILGMVLIESIAIYGLVVGLLLVFAIPV